MFLRRIQIPDFRVLKDVDITFEPEFSPRIFPLGSLNGGGKSTLLQLIFILLGCSGDPEKHIFIQNMLAGFEIEEGQNKRLLTTIHLFDNEQDIKLQFFVHKNEIPIEQISIDQEDIKSLGTILKFSMLGLDKQLAEEISDIKVSLSELDRIEEKTIKMAQENQVILHETHLKKEKIELVLNEISNYLKNQNLIHICNYINNSNSEEYAVLYNIEQLDLSEANNLLQQLANKIFLAAPLTQVFLFISKSNTKLLFKTSKDKKNYYSELEDIKSKLPNLFTYDLLSVDYILESFKAARDEDFKQAIETGEYGDAYKSILKELNSLLGNKKINVDTDLLGVNFKINRDGKTKELYPEDLSHGELKRLSIYVWLKYKNIKDSLVLIDEIENAFHPDWQYQIISDLIEWGASNQYILATHSYELCQALTPAHVKELEPKLLGEKQVEN
ncbi:MAG: AAA family ATPase [Waterburya sp.]